jgi:hypothetical protein
VNSEDEHNKILRDRRFLRGCTTPEPPFNAEAIYPEDLLAWEKKTGIKIESGDAQPIH